MDEVPVSPAAVSLPESYEGLAGLIDLHVLEPEVSDDHVAEACRIAREYSIRALIARPSDVDNMVRWLGSSPVVPGSTVGYPDGSTTTGAKLYEGRDLLRRGAREIEMVVNVGKLVSRQFQYVEMELLQMAKSCHEAGASFTVILRNELLADDLHIIATKIARRIEADFLSVAPTAGAFERIVPLLKGQPGLKASNAPPRIDEVVALRTAGCTRIGCKDAATLLDAWRAHLDRSREERESGPPLLSRVAPDRA